MNHLGLRFWFFAACLFVLVAPFLLPVFLWLVGHLYRLFL